MMFIPFVHVCKKRTQTDAHSAKVVDFVDFQCRCKFLECASRISCTGRLSPRPARSQTSSVAQAPGLLSARRIPPRRTASMVHPLGLPHEAVVYGS
jgi:hypothetical protein